MDALRLSLLIFGAFVIGGVYLWTSHLQQKKRQRNIGWESPDSHTISNVTVGKETFSKEIWDKPEVSSDDAEELRFTPHGDIPDVDVEKIYTQDIAKESINFNDTGEFKTLSQVIAEAKSKETNSEETISEQAFSKKDVQTPSVFVKPKIYASKLDETKSHIKAVHERERQQTKAPKQSGLVIVINLLARPRLVFKGEKILRSVENAGLKFGDMNIFHYYNSTTDAKEGQSNEHLFSLANIVNPGTFEKNQMNTLTTPGVSLFMQLPGPADGVKTFEKMLSVAQTLKKELDGELCDESRSALTYQTISHLKEQIKEYCFKYQQA